MFNPEQCDFVSMAEAKARAEQNPAAETARAASIAFVVMAEAGQIDDVTAVENASQFSPWAYPVAYTEGQIRRDPLDGNLYRVNKGQGHTSQEGWNPSLTPALWSKIGDPGEEWPEWSQPLGAHDAYNTGDKVPGHWEGNTFVYNRDDPEGGMFVGPKGGYVRGHFTMKRAAKRTKDTQQARVSRKITREINKRMKTK